MPSIRKISDGKYRVRISKQVRGRRECFSYTFRGSRKEANRFGLAKETELDGGELSKTRFTFADYFTLWLKAIRPKVRPRTYDGYKAYIERYAKHRLDRMDLTDIRPHHIQQILLDIDKSPGTVRQLHASLNACFGWAVRRDYIRVNPCKNADLPQRQHKEITVLTPAEAFEFVRICREMPHGTIFEFALETGMRPEEYLALRWRDIREREVSVQQIVQYNRSGGGFYFDKPKTAKSRRLLDISENMRLALVRHRREQNDHRLKMKTSWFNHDLVFPNEIGNPFALPNVTRRYFRPILEKMWPVGTRTFVSADGVVGVEPVPNPDAKPLTLYSLRHSCATLLLMSGKNPKVVADRLGHSSVVITLDTYSHVLPHIQADATDALDNILRFKKQA